MPKITSQRRTGESCWIESGFEKDTFKKARRAIRYKTIEINWIKKVRKFRLGRKITF